ncbi:hypothetical protein SSBR45G_32330 [Bradyrhizobium sp. SSBR45G]|nr:hypothetical protein SSBR45G_32330 [Bradyrhizobium sp. SSBR45G]GLH86107.1 hypothetical protein SSBR45R_35670 [Bradyrhizobium sp. SSBR45R]
MDAVDTVAGRRATETSLATSSAELAEPNATPLTGVNAPVTNPSPMSLEPSSIAAETLDERKLALERYKARLDFWKFVLGSVVAAIAIATIPPSFQYATAYLEMARKTAEREQENQRFRNEYVKDFLNKALDQDIENRIRLAQYFSNVTTDAFKIGWQDYLKLLTDRRDKLFDLIDKTQTQLYLMSQDRTQHAKEIEELNRQLQRYNHELGVGVVLPGADGKKLD